MLERIYSLSSRSRLEPGLGVPVLVSAYPLQRIELNPTAFAVVRALDGTTPLRHLVEGADASQFEGLVAFLEGLVTQGCLTVRYALSPPEYWPTVEVVIPVLNNPAGVQRCLTALVQQTYPRERWSITLVDDGSSPPVARPSADAFPGLPPVRVLRLDVNRGPADARNAALFARVEYAPTELIAFTDSDCVPEPQWLVDLASVLEEPGLVAAGGRVSGQESQTLLGRYEGECSSLNLGSTGGPAGDPADRFPYLPSCNLMVRRAALGDVGGFRTGLRLGEDVDLSCRLHARGYRLFYFPGGTVRHAYRNRLRPFLARKAAYASTEGWLRRAHATRATGRASPIAGIVLGVLALAAALWGVAGAGLAVAAVALLLLEGAWRWGTLRKAAVTWPWWAVPLALARRSGAMLLIRCRSWVRQHALFGAGLAVLAIWLPGLWLWALAVFAAAAWGEWMARRPDLPSATFLAGYALDVLAYSWGRWRSRLRRGSRSA